MLKQRTIKLERGRTSIKLEPTLWNALKYLCEKDGVKENELFDTKRIEELEARFNAFEKTPLWYYRFDGETFKR